MSTEKNKEPSRDDVQDMEYLGTVEEVAQILMEEIMRISREDGHSVCISLL